jgi:hypothetical protein
MTGLGGAGGGAAIERRKGRRRDREGQHRDREEQGRRRGREGAAAGLGELEGDGEIRVSSVYI